MFWTLVHYVIVRYSSGDGPLFIIIWGEVVWGENLKENGFYLLPPPQKNENVQPLDQPLSPSPVLRKEHISSFK